MLFSFVAIKLPILLVWIVCGSIASATANEFEERLPRSVSIITYTDVNDDEVSLRGFLVLPPSLASINIDVFDTNSSVDDDFEDTSVSGFPAVIILPDSNSINGYEISRATRIASQLGCIVFVADIYGSNLHNVQDFRQQTKLADTYKGNHTLFRSRIDSAIAILGEQPHVDTSTIALVGYGLGGTGAILYSFAGNANIVAAVSFHGDLIDFPMSNATNPVLLLTGTKDDPLCDFLELETDLVAANADWQITRYSGIRHDFTVYGSVTYNEWVDQRSSKEMATFLQESFGTLQYGSEYIEDDDGVEEGGNITTSIYTDSHGTDIGAFTLPAMEDIDAQFPVVLILLDSGKPISRPVQWLAYELAHEGYATLVVDFFAGVPSPTLIQRIRIGIDEFMQEPIVDASNSFILGIGNGGSAGIEYAIPVSSLQNQRGVVLIGGNSIRWAGLLVQNRSVKPYILILSPGADADRMAFESSLSTVDTNWEISWRSSTDSIINLQSWWSMLSLFESLRGGADYSDSRTKEDVFSDIITFIEVEGNATNTTVESLACGNSGRWMVLSLSFALLFSGLH